MKINSATISKLAAHLRTSLPNHTGLKLAISPFCANKNFLPFREREIKSPLMGIKLVPMDVPMGDPSEKFKEFWPYLIYVKHVTIEGKKVMFGITPAKEIPFNVKSGMPRFVVKAFGKNDIPDGTVPTMFDIGTFLMAKSSQGFKAGLRLANGIYPAGTLEESGFIEAEKDEQYAESILYAKALVTFEYCLKALSSPLPAMTSPFTGVALYHFSFGLGEEMFTGLGEMIDSSSPPN